jgi:poly-gamma-glutamate capsule biosynthesis protein CapA/YwtB (metallophosphatase superfamily)
MRLALAGDTMLGRGVAQSIEQHPGASLFSSELVEITRSCDLFVLNLECCISERGRRWPASGKPFFFRAPPAAVDVLAELGVHAVTLANNHALDYGYDALLDTFDHLARAGIAWVGAGGDEDSARAPLHLNSGAGEVTVVGCTDHPSDFAATPATPGVALANLRAGLPEWLAAAVGGGKRPLIVSPHWGPNMTSSPPRYVRAAAGELLDAGATLVAGHSAHVFHGVASGVLFDLGDFVDDYRIDPQLRNDLGVLFLVEFEGSRPARLEAVPLKLEYCYTRLARGKDYEWIKRRLRAACGEFGTEVTESDGRLLVTPI